MEDGNVRARPRAVGAMAVIACLVAALVLAGVRPAAALDTETTGTQRVLGDLTQQRLVLRLDDGAVARGNVLRFPEDSEQLTFRPKLARGTIAGIERFDRMAAGEVARGAVAGINGGYWLERPNGAPNGLYVQDGRMLAASGVNRSGNPVRRGVLGIGAAGNVLLDRLDVTLELDLPGGLPEEPVEPIVIDEINRQVRNGEDGTRDVDGEVLLFDRFYGAPFDVPGGSTMATIEGLELGTAQRTEGVVVDVYRPVLDTSYAVPEDTYVLLAYGDEASDLAELQEGSPVGVTPTIEPINTDALDWEDLPTAVPAGPLLLRDGERFSVDDWRSEAFSDTHVTGRQPRTAIGRTPDGEVLLVTIDGRQNGWSVGLTLRELSAVLIELGAREALNLDGGGSTTMTINGGITNRPSEVGRAVSNGLFLYSQMPPGARGLERACPPGVAPSAGFDDTRGNVHEASIDCLAWWGVTSGRTPDTYDPAGGVTREQMATFLARWIDDVAARGSGKALPSADASPFEDVVQSNVHRDAIARLTAAEVIGGRTPTTYEPERIVSRAQTATLVAGAIEYATGVAVPDTRDTFSDDATSVHEDAIDRLSGIGVIAGVGGFGFDPEGDVSRAAMASLLQRGSDHLVESGHITPPS